jgi:RHS repeat-associated protein
MWRDDNLHGDFLDSNETLYYTQDANFNVTALVNTSGTVLERTMYDPYGKPTFYDANWANPSDSTDYANEVLFAGYRYDSETGLYDVRHRTYHPPLGRWLSRDPVGYADGMSLYEYVASDPVGYTDPRGLAVRVIGDRQLAQQVKQALDQMCPCYNGKGNISKIVESGGVIRLNKTWQGKPYDPDDSAAVEEFCCKCYTPDKKTQEQLQAILTRLKNRAAITEALKKRHQVRENLESDIDALARAIQGVRGYRGRMTSCNLVWRVLVQMDVTIEARRTNIVDRTTGRIGWDPDPNSGYNRRMNRPVSIGLGHELTHVGAGLVSGSRTAESKVVRGGENPLRYEANQPLRRDIHGGGPLVNDTGDLLSPDALMEIPPRMKGWCEGLWHQ